jgi:nicotinamidase-related amidase
MKKTIILIIVCFYLLGGLIAQDMSTDTDKKRALIIVDVQEFYFPEGFSPLVEPEKASDKAADVLNSFRENEELIVHVKHDTKKDSAIHADVRPEKGEKVITKHYANSYRETGLLDFLNQHEVNEVVVCGMMTHMCVEATARASADFGFKVIVLDDACATKDIVYGNDTVPASAVHLSTLGSIDRYYGKVMTVEEFLRQ